MINSASAAVIVPCSRHYDTMVWLNVSLLVTTMFEVFTAVASVVVCSRALHRGRGCFCCCTCCYDAVDPSSTRMTASAPPPSFVIYTRGNLVDMESAASCGGSGGSGGVSSAHSALLALPPSNNVNLSVNGIHPQYFSFHAPDVPDAAFDLTGARYTADEVSTCSSVPASAIPDASITAASATANGFGNQLADDGGRLLYSRSPPPSYEDSVKR